MTRSLASLVLILTASGGFAQSKPITYSSPGGSAKQVLADLSAKTGLKLQTTPLTESEFLYINVQNVAKERLLEEIAWSVWGSWKIEGNSYTLVRTDSDRSRADREARSLEIEAFRSGLARKSRELAKLGSFTEESAQEWVSRAENVLKAFRPEGDNSRAISSLTPLVRSTPVRRLLLGLVCRMTPQELADLSPDVPVVFSNRPTPMQRAFGDGVRPTIKQYAQEEALWREAARRANLPSGDAMVAKYGISGIPEYDYEGEPTRILMVARKNGGIHGACEFRLYVTNARGDVVAQQFEMLSSEDLINLKDPATKEVTVQLTEAEVEFPHALPNLELLNARNLSRLLAPEEHDPLSLFVSPVLSAYCRAKKVNMVASLPDESMILAILGSDGRMSASSIEKYLAVLAQPKTASGLTAWRPLNLKASQSHRSNRRDLREYYRRSAEFNSLNLDEKGDWAARLPITGTESSLVASLAGVVHRSATGQKEFDEYNPEVLRLYGSLTASQRSQLRKQGLLLRDLTKKQLELLSELTYGGNVQLERSDSEAKPFSPVMSLPTEMLPKGIPAETRITLEAEPIEVISVTALMGQSDRQTVLLSPGSVANYRVSQKRPDLNPWVLEQNYDLEKVIYGRQTFNKLTILYNDQVSQVFHIEERSFPSKKAVKFDDLPESFLAAYRKAYKQFEEDAKNEVPAVTPTNTNPPPPRQ